MIVTNGRLVMCDHPDCGALLRWPGRGAPSPAELRRLSIEMHGWGRDRAGGDRCPEHPDRRIGDAEGG